MSNQIYNLKDELSEAISDIRQRIYDLLSHPKACADQRGLFDKALAALHHASPEKQRAKPKLEFDDYNRCPVCKEEGRMVILETTTCRHPVREVSTMKGKITVNVEGCFSFNAEEGYCDYRLGCSACGYEFGAVPDGVTIDWV